MRPLTAAQAVAAAVALARLARGRRRLPPISSDAPPPGHGVSVVVPARDEAARIGSCLDKIGADPDVTEVIVVDDGSADATARIAAGAGAMVIAAEPPPGWVGKQWALQRGVQAARGPVVITLDADTRPRPGLAAAAVAALRAHRYDLLSVAPRFVCDGLAEQLLHASMLAGLVYRFGPIGVPDPPRPARTVTNGQCLVFDREALLAAGGFCPVRANLTDDVALARTLAARGWRIGLLDGRELLDVDMHASAAQVWREWGRSLPMSDVTSTAWQVADLTVVWLTMALPPLRAVTGRARPLDWGLLAVRVALLAALRGSYRDPGPGLWCSPLADVAAAARLTTGVLRPARTWRGRTYPRAPRGRTAAR